MAVPDWPDLHPDLLEQVAIKLIEIEDFTAFRGVCRSWRGSVAEIKDTFVSKVPQLMFRGEEGWGLYSWRKRRIFSRIAVPADNFERKICINIGVGFGWIITEEEVSGEVSLVNPRSCAKIKLPNSKMNMKHAVVSANPSENSDFMVMFACGNVQFWRNGDTKWSMIDSPDQVYLNICYYKHKLYAIEYFFGKLWMWDPHNPNQPPEGIMKFDYKPHRMGEFLVESTKGDLLLIICMNDQHYEVSPSQSIRIDTEKRGSVSIQSLDGDAIFIDRYSAVSVAAAADFPGIVRPNCIYYPDHNCEPPRMEIYSVEHKSVDYVGLDSFCPQGKLQWLL